MNIDLSGPHSRFIRCIVHSCEMALSVAFVIFVVAVAPTMAYVSLITRGLALAGFGVAFLFNGGICGATRDRPVAWGALAGFTVGFGLEMITAMRGSDIDHMSYVTFAVVRFFLCAGRIAAEAAMLRSVLLNGQMLLLHWNKRRAAKLESIGRVSVTLLLCLAILVLIEYSTGS
jgi:hypothetical protein